MNSFILAAGGFFIAGALQHAWLGNWRAAAASFFLGVANLFFASMKG